MREILFRGKRKDTGEWVYGYLGVFKGISQIYVPFTEEEEKENEGHIFSAIGGLWHTVSPETIGQYTGLSEKTDKNGKKIFEGDIIRYADEGEYNMYLESLECPEDYEGVDFSDLWTYDIVVYGIAVGYPAFDLNNHEWECNGLSNLGESYQYFYEVIGNIHDNPELLKECEGK